VIGLPGVAPTAFAIHAVIAAGNGVAGVPRHAPPGFTQHATGVCVYVGTASLMTIFASGSLERFVYVIV
jgi:hypothetical protein